MEEWSEKLRISYRHQFDKDQGSGLTDPIMESRFPDHSKVEFQSSIGASGKNHRHLIMIDLLSLSA